MTNQQAPEIYTLHTVPNKGERPWSGIYTVRADAEHDAKVMRDATGRDWSVVRLVVADTAATPTGPITRYEVVDCIDSKHVPAVIPNGAGPWVRYEDHVAALVEAQQPDTHVQQSTEIEHVAGDVSKNGVKSNMAQQPAPSAAVALSDDLRDRLVAISEAVADQDDRAAQAMLREILAAPQPSTTPPADSHPAPVLDRARIREIFMAHGFTVKEGRTDLKQYVYDAADALLRAARAPADSVTAPTSWATWQDISTAPKDGTRFVAVGQNYGLGSEKQHTCIAQWLAGCWVEVSDWNGASKLKYLTHWMPLPPLPGSAARAPADSVLEDAARLDWLALAGPVSICLVIDQPHDGEIEVATDDVTGYGKTLREALDAARKQGGA